VTPSSAAQRGPSSRASAPAGTRPKTRAVPTIVALTTVTSSTRCATERDHQSRTQRDAQREDAQHQADGGGGEAELVARGSAPRTRARPSPWR
jgi:hypothetical protein